MDPFVSEEGAELLAIFVSPRIGEVMPLERVRYISLSYISTSCCCVYPPPPSHLSPLRVRPVLIPMEHLFVRH